jgi:hypothetical protein
MKVVKLETYKTTFGRLYQPFCPNLKKKRRLLIINYPPFWGAEEGDVLSVNTSPSVTCYSITSML